jgi:hypothetical protein
MSAKARILMDANSTDDRKQASQKPSPTPRSSYYIDTSTAGTVATPISSLASNHTATFFQFPNDIRYEDKRNTEIKQEMLPVANGPPVINPFEMLEQSNSRDNTDWYGPNWDVDLENNATENDPSLDLFLTDEETEMYTAKVSGINTTLTHYQTNKIEENIQQISSQHEARENTVRYSQYKLI